MPILDTTLVVFALAVALSLRPWRMMRGGQLLAPALATLVLLPWVWALPALHPMPLSLRWSGACLVLLMLGWPLAVPVLLAVALLAGFIGALGPADMLSLAIWQGLLPATLALAAGGAVRRWLPPNPFVYILARAFIATVLCAFAAAWLARLDMSALPAKPTVDDLSSNVALWLMAWSDGTVTAMLAAIFVAYRPEWLATWSDRHYLPRT
ncbi:hypothetical protein ACQ858_08815 [Variovorax ureilyticus]|uniref:hypothetical protein n=1 Tax=Variovorax ureilyticus TaxID=1836198 RepID=UPI003D67D233